MRLRRALTLPLLTLSVLACSSEDGDPDAAVDAGPADSGIAADAGPSDTGAAADVGGEIDAGFADAGDETDAGPADSGVPEVDPDCDPLQPGVCSFPWPSNLYLEEDALRETGVTLAFGETSLPANNGGLHVRPEPYRRLDGYGVGTPIMVRFANLDPSGLPDETDIGASMDADAEILLFRAGGKGGLTRVPYFAETDQREPDLSQRILFVRPAVILDEATRYVVAFRNLVDTDGNTYAPSPAFAALVAGDTSGDPNLAPRQARFDAMFAELESAGVPKASLQLAWDFSTASSEALHGAMLAIRDDALARIDANLPTPTITSVTEYAPAPDDTGRPVDENLAFRVEGEVTVPSYLRLQQMDLLSDTVLNRDVDGVPQVNGTRTIEWWMNIPHSARTSTNTMDLVLYGHGLLGTGEQVLSSYNRPVANREHFIMFGASLTGFDDAMLTTVGLALRNMSAFEWVAETIHQGLAEYLMLARIMQRQASQLSVVTNNGITVSSNLYYSGISQGGIFGATLMAIATDITHGHLGVPGSNYSLLLQRSVDFEPFFSMLQTAYATSTDHAILLSTVQQIWEMTDPVSYMRHITAEPFANTPNHRVLLAPAKGDYQVSVLSNELAARADIGLPIMERYDDERTVYGVSYASYPRQGSGIVLWDFGNPWPPAGNVTPSDSLGDPHGKPRRNADHIRQLGHFLRTGEIIDVCGGDGCIYE